jgi:hypothetical protein
MVESYATPEAAWAAYEAGHLGVRQWLTVKVVVGELDAAFQHIADADGRVEKLHHNGGRDWIVFWSKPVTR